MSSQHSPNVYPQGRGQRQGYPPLTKKLVVLRNTGQQLSACKFSFHVNAEYFEGPPEPQEVWHGCGYIFHGVVQHVHQATNRQGGTEEEVGCCIQCWIVRVFQPTGFCHLHVFAIATNQ